MKTSSGSCLGEDGVLAPGFRFHPTDEELVVYYLKRKICRKTLRANVIGVTDVYKWDPEELPGQSLYQTRDRLWFFFSPRDRKYPNGARSNRGTANGYWKATGKDRTIMYNSRPVGLKKTLIFYRGRAPKGVRTDWVMHEYTLDEEELLRSENLKEYYVLYKVYKKSGPGPKNGEQYGAPFVEEDWVDDGVQVASMPADPDVPTNQCNGTTHAYGDPVNGLDSDLLDDYDIEVSKQVVDKPALPRPEIQVGNHTCANLQDGYEGETHTALVCSSSRELILPEVDHSFDLNTQLFDDQAFFDFGQSARPVLPSSEKPVEPKSHEPALNLSEDDYLEIDDLLAARPDMPGTEEPTEKNWNLDEFDVLSDFDFFDAESFFQKKASQPNVGGLGNNVENGLDQLLKPNTSGVNYQVDCCQFDRQTGMEQLGYHAQPYVSNVDQICSGVWTQEHALDLRAQFIPTSGVASEHVNPPLPHPPPPATGVADQDRQRKEDGDGSSDFTSSFWAFLDSIPTTPASASENPMMNRAFGRVSSFSHFRLTSKNTSIIVGSDAATIKRPSCQNKKGFFLLSVLGALCAVFWVFVGALGVSGRSIFS